MFLLDSLLIDGLRFVLDKVAAAAEVESQDDTALRERLLEAQLQLELGDISDEEFAEIERDVLARIREMKGGGGAVISMGDGEDASVEVESYEPHRR
jgi:hypothetical protein